MKSFTLLLVVVVAVSAYPSVEHRAESSAASGNPMSGYMPNMGNMANMPQMGNIPNMPSFGQIPQMPSAGSSPISQSDIQSDTPQSSANSYIKPEAYRACAEKMGNRDSAASGSQGFGSFMMNNDQFAAMRDCLTGAAPVASAPV